jgi:chaperonin GroES
VLRRRDHAPDAAPWTKKEEVIVNIKPLADRVLVRALEEAEVKRGGIIIPDTAKEKPQEGEVMAVGPGRINEKGDRVPLEVKKGDRILFGKYSGTEVTVAGDSLLIMRESDILAIL